jgi:phenylacetate-CoA ligase
MQAVVKKLKTSRVGDLAVRRNPIFYASQRDQLHALAHANLAERRAWTHERLREVLRAAARSDYGRSITANTTLERWPLLEKSSVRGARDAFISGPALFASKATTSGTTGMPLKLTRSLRSIVFEQVCLDELLRLCGVDPQRARTVVMRADAIKPPSDQRPPFWITVANGERMMFSPHHLSAATVAQYADALEAFRPDALWAYPTSLESLCLNLRRIGRKVHIPNVLTSSEVLQPQVWRLAQEMLGCKVLDHYGQAERVAFAYAREPEQYRFLPGYAYVELHPVTRGPTQTIYEIVGTNLWNLAMPLPRYRTGDLVALPASWGAAELEEVALGVRTFSGVIGREVDVLVSPDGVRLTGINHFPRFVSHVVRIQVIQEAADHVRILVLPDTGYSERDAEQLMSNVREKLPADMRVSIEPVETLEKTAQNKTPFIIHRPPVQALLSEGRDVGAPA